MFNFESPFFIFWFKNFNYLPQEFSKFNRALFLAATPLSFLKATLISTFLRRGLKLSTVGLFADSTLVLNSLIFNNPSLTLVKSWNLEKLSFIDISKTISSVFFKIKFLSLFFFEKLNKHIYKYSKYKRPRYSIKYFFVKPYKRFKTLIKLFQKSLIFESGRSFSLKLTMLLLRFVLTRKGTFIMKLISWIQGFIFKTRRNILIY